MVPCTKINSDIAMIAHVPRRSFALSCLKMSNLMDGYVRICTLPFSNSPSNSISFLGIPWHLVNCANVWGNIVLVSSTIRDIRPLLREIFPASIRARFPSLGLEYKEVTLQNVDDDEPFVLTPNATEGDSSCTSLALKENV